ncbi:hypothetical protein ENBRE01_0955 [Enteropsectra breve]|nr:hypothetical protein ENBRE01_0955 [Enteropsectra breve]
MEYQLASSSTEEGEVIEDGFPYYRSYLQYYYHPKRPKFLGKNSMPHYINYKSDVLCSKLKKELKADYPYLSFNIQELNQAFFENKFNFVANLEKKTASTDNQNAFIPHLFEEQEDAAGQRSGEMKLIDIKTHYKTLNKFPKKTSYEGKYDKFYQQLFFNRDDRSQYVKNIITESEKSLFIFEDRILDAIENPKMYIFFRVIEEKVARENTATIKKYIFEDIFYNNLTLYEYLDTCQETVVKAYNSEEIRKYCDGENTYVVHSSTTFYKNNVLRKLYGGVDGEKNYMVVLNKEGPEIAEFKGTGNDNINYLRGLDLGEGDYLINNKMVYAVGNQGSSIEYVDVDYNDFITSRWK